MGKAIETVRTLDDVWLWIEATLVRVLWGSHQGVLLDFNALVGGVRVTQKRWASATCPGYEDLANGFNISCFSNSELTDSPIGGEAGEKGINGFVSDSEQQYSFWLDITQNASQVIKHVDKFHSNSWLAPGVKELNIQLVFYNVQIAFFILV